MGHNVDPIDENTVFRCSARTVKYAARLRKKRRRIPLAVARPRPARFAAMEV